jgi:hypothetical protein
VIGSNFRRPIKHSIEGIWIMRGPYDEFLKIEFET